MSSLIIEDDDNYEAIDGSAVTRPQLKRAISHSSSSAAHRAVAERFLGRGSFGLFAVMPEPFSSEKPLSRTAS
jgi:hypothetical protein